ncbi:hypothetical protein BAZ12_00890 [Elizabethkingia miricola]|uniref:Uncharacterized protein n=1 Tax=Elizabethkingia miricola TaxID=172045 RepID=A0ABD4DL40_ELIMR|nr:hypothetical protein ATB95_14020 [Elizabethkingia miricola]OPC34336.1 hypothetical protein BAX99_05500 [Elizabethkingia miricola]OPC68517.1 hypothetical protein BAZ13_13945 [Elizabethkingia miricola]OPC75629.1 hypothetical protein BAZ12_00890 [Elizabethkingia miricola]
MYKNKKYSVTIIFKLIKSENFSISNCIILFLYQRNQDDVLMQADNKHLQKKYLLFIHNPVLKYS